MSQQAAQTAQCLATTSDVGVNGVSLTLLVEGAVYWARENALIVSDLHLEKGSSFARRGMMVPPYDTKSTLNRLGSLLSQWRPKRVFALGDNFHDRWGAERMAACDQELLASQLRGREWVWITGNHDPEPQMQVGGEWVKTLEIGGLVLRHEPSQRAGTLDLFGDRSTGELCGHLHPSAKVSARGRGVRRPCFATDGRRMVLPAFGALTGGLDVRDPAFRPVFGSCPFHVHLLGRDRLYAHETRCR